MMSHTEENNATTQSGRAATQRSPRSLFTVPTPIKQLFDKFPLHTYPVNDLPRRAPQNRNAHVLYIFTSQEGAQSDVPSYNPACLKWQVSTSYDAVYPPTYSITGLPQILQDRLPDSFSEQSCITEWCSALHNTCIA
jgi:hypothetical protein